MPGITPGPWQQRNVLSATVLARREHTNAIGETMVWDAPVAVAQPWPDNQRLANAKAIAAVPRLIEALIGAEEFLAESGFIGSTLDEVRAALLLAGVSES